MEAEGQTWFKTKLEHFSLWLESQTHFPFVVATGCCKPELENVVSSTYDWKRLGVELPAQGPCEADLLIVAGWVNKGLAELLRKAHADLVGRKSVIAVGACAISGGPYARAKQGVTAVSDILPVDVFVPGCPPRPEAIIEAIRLLKFRLQPRPDQTSVLYSAIKETGKAL